MEKYLATIEFRYSKVTKYGDDTTFTCKTVTIGVYEDFEDACKAGNGMLEGMEKKFPLHVFPNGRGTAKKERFSLRGGCFGSKKDLITSGAYLKTPFEFYAKIETLKYDPVEETIDNVVEQVKKYREFKSKQEE